MARAPSSPNPPRGAGALCAAHERAAGRDAPAAAPAGPGQISVPRAARERTWRRSRNGRAHRVARRRANFAISARVWRRARLAWWLRHTDTHQSRTSEGGSGACVSACVGGWGWGARRLACQHAGVCHIARAPIVEHLLGAGASLQWCCGDRESGVARGGAHTRRLQRAGVPLRAPLARARSGAGK